MFILNSLKSHLRYQFADIGSTSTDWRKLLSIKLTDLHQWTDQLTSFRHSVPDPILEEFPALSSIHHKLAQLKASIVTQNSIFTQMIEKLLSYCDSDSPHSHLPYTTFVPAFDTNGNTEVDLKHLISLLLNEIHDWICATLLECCSSGFDECSFTQLEKMMTIGDDTLMRVAVIQTFSSNIRYG